MGDLFKKFLAPVLGWVGNAIAPGIGGILGTALGGALGGGGGGDGGGQPQQPAAPPAPPGVDPYAFSAAMAALPSQQAATSAFQQEASLLNYMTGALPSQDVLRTTLGGLMDPRGNVPAQNYQIGRLQTDALTRATQMREQLARRGITGPIADQLIQQGVSEPAMKGEADIRARGAAGATGMQETALRDIFGFAGGAERSASDLGRFFSGQATAAAAPWYQQAMMQGYLNRAYPRVGAPPGGLPMGGSGGIPLPPMSSGMGAGMTSTAGAGMGADYGLGLPPADIGTMYVPGMTPGSYYDPLSYSKGF